MKQLCATVLIVCSIILTSCASSNRHAGKLSEAMDKSSDNHEGERKVTAVVVEDPEEEENEDQIIYEQKNEHVQAGTASTEGLSFGIQAGSGVLSSESFYGVTSFSFALEQFYKEKRSAFIELGGLYAPLQTAESDEFDPDDEIVKALNGGIFSLYSGIKLRFYTTSEHTFIGNFFGFGFGVNSMFWNYKNDLEIEEYDENGNYAGTETISGDQLWGLDLNGSAGINLVQTENFVLGVEFNPGIIIWGLETYEGFTNDVFEPFFYFKTNFNFMIK
ncbi:MAG: hypothetical protein AB7V07_00255 [Candidatus Delongbacteria bacterium]